MREFREAVAADSAAIAALVNSCYRGDSSRQGWTTEADLLDGTRTNEEEIRSLIETPGSLFLLCVDGREIIGSVHLQREESSGYLGMLVVKPDVQAGGMGSRLMEAGEALVRDKWKLRRMTMNVFTVRPELLSYYGRRGYRRTGKVKPFHAHDVHGTPRVEGLELEVLEKDL